MEKRGVVVALSLTLLGCAAPAEPTAGTCDYPAFDEPMSEGAAIAPYGWPEAVDADGSRAPLDLTRVPCDDDPEREWSPFDALLFVSIPAW